MRSSLTQSLIKVIPKPSAAPLGRAVSSMPPRYPGHVPLTAFEKVVLTVGSAGAALLNPRRADMIAALSETTSPLFLPSLRDTMFATPEGRAILRDRPRIHSETIDLPSLRLLPEGTFGREYCDWLERCNTSPDTRLPVQHVDDPELAYVLQRYRETHDLLHTLFGFPPNLLPELGLKLFEATHYSLPMPVLSSISILSPFNTLSLAQRSLLLREYLPWAADAGRACRPLIGVYWERRWEQDIWDLREELGVSGLMPNREWEGMRFRGKTWREKEVIRERKERERVDMEAKLKEETEKMAAAQEVNSEGSPLL